MTYAIFNKDHAEYFIGFDINGDAQWGDIDNALRWKSRLHAETQALLLAQDCEGVQREARELCSH